MGSLTLRTTTKLAAAAVAALAVAVPQALAFDGIANTGPNPGPAGTETYGHVAGGPDILADRILAVPFDPSDATEAAQTAALWSPGTPENDLGDALDALASAGTVAEAASARDFALSILEGRSLPKKAYDGIPLLNYDAPAKVKHVAPGGTVEITQVRWGEHMVSDTWMLEFEDPSQPFSIRYRVAELGSAFGGQLNPTPLLTNGAQQVGQHSAVQPLGIDGQLDTGTTQQSRFTTRRGLGAVPEQTRAAVQEITVDMPPAGMVTAILDPNLRAGHETATTLVPATAERLAAAKEALGYTEDLVGGRPSDADRAAAIGKLAAGAPEKIIWQALKGLPAEDSEGFVAAANAAGAGNRSWVSVMRSRSQTPPGAVPDPAADATIVLQNNEAYLERRKLRLAPDGSLKIQVVNQDGFDHEMTAFDLHDRQRIFGAEDWGAFSWQDRELDDPVVPKGESRTFTITPDDSAFAVWIGDLVAGDQGNAVIELDRSVPKQEALSFGAGTLPVHAAPDQQGNVWVTLAGVDKIARVTPAPNLEDSRVDLFPIPGGRHQVDSPTPPLAPSDITVDGRGIVWTTLSSGNAVARIDPSAVQPDTGNGITKLALDPCTENPECLPEVPPVPNEQPTRRPTRVKTMIDGQGHTVVWFAEAGASSVGVLRVTEDGQQITQTHFPCGCLEIESLDLAPDGSVWFAEVFENRIGRLRPDRTRPYSASAVQVDHFPIPTAVRVEDPGAPGGVANTSLPLSLAVDGRGRVWFSQSALSGIAYLDPAQAVPNTSAGFVEKEMPGSDFRSPAAPADVGVDRANNFWWAGEYGDQIEQLNPDGTQGHRFRGSVRRGITEGPVADVDGNLWVVESGGNVLTRITGVTEGPLVPFGAPAGYEADVTGDRVTGARVRDAASVDVRVRRNNVTVASATVPVSDGAFDVSGGDWAGPAADRVRPDDTVLIKPNGPFERAELSFRVAALTASIDGSGLIVGRATVDGNALADRVTVVAGGNTLFSGINGGTGAWKVDAGEAITGGTVSWSGATVAGSFRTVMRFGTEPAPQPNPGTGGTGGSGASGGAGGGATPPATATTPSPQPGPTAQTGGSKTVAPAECRKRTWLYGSARSPKVLLLGRTADQVTACLGRPVARRAARGKRLESWTYASGLAVRFRAGRVASIGLRGAALRTSRGRVGVGSKLSRLKKVLPGLVRDGRSRRYRARIGRATVKVTVDRAAKIRIIEVTR